MATALANRLSWYTTTISAVPGSFDDAHSYLEQNVRNVYDKSDALRFKGELVIPVRASDSNILTATRFYVKTTTTVTLSVLSTLSADITMFVRNNTDGSTATYTLSGAANAYRSRSLSVSVQKDYTIILTQNGATNLFIKTTSDDELYPYIRAYVIGVDENTATRINANSITSGTLSANRLPASGVNPGTYGSLSNIPIVTVDTRGRITGITVSTAIVGGGGGSTNASDLVSGTLPVERLPSTGINASAITIGTLSSNVLEDLVAPFTYGASNTIPVITVDSKGRITYVTEQDLAFSYQNVQGLATVASSGDYNDLVNRTFVLRSGSNAVYLNGNVGIGTAAPSTALHVIGTVRATAFEGSFPSVTLPDPLYVNLANVGIGTTLPTATLQVNGDIQATTLSGALTPSSMPSPFTIYEGRVGIGSTKPEASLVVNGDIKAATLYGALPGSNITGTIPATSLPAPLKITDSNITILDSSVSIHTQSNGSAVGLEVLNLGQGDDLRIGSDIQTHMVVKSNGRVAILQDNPTVELDVNGDIKCHNLLCDSAITTTDLNVTGTFTTVNTVNTETDQFTICNLGTATPLRVYQLSAGSKNVVEFFSPTGSAFKIANSGYIGVGSTVPAYEMDVLGNINFTGNLYKNGVLYSSTNASQLTSGTLDSARLAASGVSAGTYGTSSAIPIITVDSKGRVTSAAASNVAISTNAITDIATVAKTGNYSSLSNLPLIWSGIHTYYGASGNLGIGTQAPTRKVDVIGTVRATAFEGSGASLTNIAANNISGTFPSSSIPSPFTIVGANVGIGTTNPVRTLHVQGDINFTGNLYQNNVLFGSTGGTTSSQWTKSGNNIYFLVGGGGQGNVGINTSAPTYPLHVNGMGFISRSDNAGTARTILNLNTTDSQAGTTAQLDFTQSSAITGRIANIYENSGKIGFAFSVWNGGLSEAMRISNNGNVGIGTATPLAKLSVQGNVIASGDIGGFGTASDARLKTDVTPMQDMLAVINQLQPVEYKWRDDIFNEEKRGTPDVGFIAQDVAPLLPLVIRSLQFPNAPEAYRGIAYDKIVPYLVKAIQELSSKLESTQKQVDDLLARL